jgi:hypothetical protein
LNSAAAVGAGFFCVVAGFTMYSRAGFASWIRNRLGDVVVFAPRYFMEAAAVVVGLTGATHVFNPSGGGDERREPVGLARLWRLLTPEKHWAARGWRAVRFRWRRARRTGGTWSDVLCRSMEHSRTWLVGLRSANWYWPCAAFGVAIFVAFLGQRAQRVGLDFGNVLLMWVILLFVTGALVGLFTEDRRVGSQTRWAKSFTVAGAGFGVLNTVVVYVVLMTSSGPWFSIFAGFVALLNALLYLIPARRWLWWVGVRDHGRWRTVRRTLSSFRRSAAKSTTLLIWFAMVPLPDTIRVAAQPIAPFVVATIDQLLAGIAGFLLLLGVVVAVGAFVSERRQLDLWSRFQTIAPKHYRRIVEPYDPETSPALTRNDALLMQFLVKMGMGLWAEAERSILCVERSETAAARNVERVEPAAATGL